jgi:hypothetical protein
MTNITTYNVLIDGGMWRRNAKNNVETLRETWGVWVAYYKNYYMLFVKHIIFTF